VFAVGMGLWWAMFAIGRGSVGADSGPLSSFMGAGSWGGAGTGWGGDGLLSVFVGWCWAWVLIADAGGGDGPSSWWVVVGPRSRRVVLGQNRTTNNDRSPPGCHVTDVAPGSGVSKQ